MHFQSKIVQAASQDVRLNERINFKTVLKWILVYLCPMQFQGKQKHSKHSNAN